MLDNRIVVFTGNANKELADKIVRHLNISMGRISVEMFSDGEIMVEIGENVRGKDVFIIQPTCAPTNNHVMELLIIIDCLLYTSPSPRDRG